MIRVVNVVYEPPSSDERSLSLLIVHMFKEKKREREGEGTN